MVKQRFILNEQIREWSEPAGMVLVDAIRNRAALKGTTVACREGDCGACSVLVGSLDGDKVRYRSITSCISPLLNASGKHIVTIEGLNGRRGVNPIQQAMMDFAGTQCGFCTPGLIVSLAGYFLNALSLDSDDAMSKLDGNICRCTGYKSIQRASSALIERYKNKLAGQEITLSALIAQGLIPGYFLTIAEKLKSLHEPWGRQRESIGQGGERRIVGGGTDLFVQRPDELFSEALTEASYTGGKIGVSLSGQTMVIGGATSIEDLKNSASMQQYIPNWQNYLKLFASTQIRHLATVAGNIVNASPIGDLSNFFLAMDASLNLVNRQGQFRQVGLKDFYQGYKQIDLQDDEIISEISFPLPDQHSYINLEKVSRRQFLDIASVTTSMHLKYDGTSITYASFSAGGVAPIPFLLRKTSAYLLGKKMKAQHVRKAVSIAQTEVNPISDVRGSANYKRLLLRQLLYGHFLTSFPQLLSLEALLDEES